jgi:hypothetical protein
MPSIEIEHELSDATYEDLPEELKVYELDKCMDEE